jgi:hypothetical protein
VFSWEIWCATFIIKILSAFTLNSRYKGGIVKNFSLTWVKKFFPFGSNYSVEKNNLGNFLSVMLHCRSSGSARNGKILRLLIFKIFF